MNNSLFRIIIAFFILFINTNPAYTLKIHKKPKLKVAFVNVGHGDSIIIKTPSGHSALIDAGAKGREKAIKFMLDKFKITERID